ncbi:MAG: zinc ribbon domain-containing protein [Clostridia bacterium]|nr:zinc ribbon domain-containing protein [Clostridia bacterium]
MKYCFRCGTECEDSATECPACGYTLLKEKPEITGIQKAAFWLMLSNTIILGLAMFIPLAWCIPLTVIYYNKLQRGEQISDAFKGCCLLFVSIPAGILMFVNEDFLKLTKK